MSEGACPSTGDVISSSSSLSSESKAMMSLAALLIAGASVGDIISELPEVVEAVDVRFRPRNWPDEMGNFGGRPRKLRLDDVR